MSAGVFIAALVVGGILVNVTISRFIHKRAHKKGFMEGYDRGYERGRIDADNWWLGVEGEADRVRQKIWKEEMEP